MSVYVLAQLTFTDEARYRAYEARFAAVFAGSGGSLLCADEAPKTLEGAWSGDKVVLMAFPEEATAMAWLNSPEYKEISQDRTAGADTVGLLLQGLA